ncbi:MAG: AMP-binding protein, partial [Bacillota bacterium]|nr:AMP-binding protein [Bacillota bacterium]
MSGEKNWRKHYPDTIASTIEIPEKSLPRVLQETTKRHPTNHALSFYGRKITYEQLSFQVTAFASALQVNGIKKGDRVAIMLPNCPQFVISYYGALTAGAIVTQVNPMSVERELEYILNDSAAETLVVFDALYPRVKTVQQSTGLKQIIVVSLQPTDQDFGPDATFEDFLSKSSGQLLPIQLDPVNDVAVLQYTGGTTGRSKGAMLTHRNLLANVIQSYEFFKHDIEIGRERYLTVIPLFHVFGMTSCMNLSIFTGSESIMLPRFDLEEVMNTIKTEQPTVFPGVPTMYVA